MRVLAIATLLAVAASARAAGDEPKTVEQRLEQLEEQHENLGHRLDEIAKAIDDVLWQQRVGDVAVVDKWRIVGPPPAKPGAPKAPGASNPVKFWMYSFVPTDRKAGERLPMLVLPHGGIHADFTSAYAHIIREIVSQGYVVIAPEYRGSTGYGREHFDLIDYGGREVDDVHAAREWAVENLEGVDPDRVGLIGWSHGGLIVLLEAAKFSKQYRCVYAGFPVSDLVARVGYWGEDYARILAGPHQPLGMPVSEHIEEYKRRSPVTHAAEIDVPLLVHTNTIDEDVSYLEVEHLARALEAAGKKFEYRVFENGPGGHHVDRIDTKLARDGRRDVYRFLARYLKPPRPVR